MILMSKLILYYLLKDNGDLLSSFESAPSSNGHNALMPPSYEDAKKIPTAGMSH